MKSILQIVMFLIVLGGSAISQEGRLLNYSIVGSASPDHSPSYGKAIISLDVQKLLLDIAAAPRTDSYIDNVLSKSAVSRADLEELRLIRREGDKYLLNFTLFTAADIKKVRAVSEKFAPSLASQFLNRRSEIDSILSNYSTPGIDRKAAAFIVLGCASLDWDGLEITAKKGYRSTSEKHPDGDYIPYAEELTDMSYEKIYWGSHNDQFGDVKLTSFGDHYSPRKTFPDFLWSIKNVKQDSGLPAILKKSTSGDQRDKSESAAHQIASIMYTLREKDCTADELVNATTLPKNEISAWLRLLTDMEYVTELNSHYRAIIPVFVKRDKEMIQKLRNIGRDIIESWLNTNYENIKNELLSTAPMRSGVPYGEGFTMIWHFIFGMTNDELVKSGLFADPYSEKRIRKGYIPAVYDKEVM
jgi:DNA-binding transcriptional ArsR family regulator